MPAAASNAVTRKSGLDGLSSSLPTSIGLYAGPRNPPVRYHGKTSPARFCSHTYGGMFCVDGRNLATTEPKYGVLSAGLDRPVIPTCIPPSWMLFDWLIERTSL